MKKTIVLILLVFAAYVFAQSRGVPARTSRYTEKSFRQRFDSIDRRLDQLAARIDKLEEKIFPSARMKHDGTALRIMAPLEVDQIVYFDDEDKFKVLEVVDANNVIIELWIRKSVQQLDSSLTWYRFRTVLQAFKTTVWLQGLNTSKWADDSIVNPSPAQLFKITGTKSYDTLFEGRKTMFVLEPLSSIKHPASSIEN